MQETWVRKIPWRSEWQPTPVFLPGESRGQRTLVGYSSWGHKESDTAKTLTPQSALKCMRLFNLHDHVYFSQIFCELVIIHFGSVQLLSRVWVFPTPWTTAHQASLSITNSRGPPKPMSIESVMPSNRLILCRPLLLLPSIFPSIRVFSNGSDLHIRWPKYWSFSFNIIPSNRTPRTDLL